MWELSLDLCLVTCPSVGLCLNPRQTWVAFVYGKSGRRSHTGDLVFCTPHSTSPSLDASTARLSPSSDLWSHTSTDPELEVC